MFSVRRLIAVFCDRCRKRAPNSLPFQPPGRPACHRGGSQTLICIDLSILADFVDIFLMLRCAERRAGGVTTIDQSDMRGLVTA